MRCTLPAMKQRVLWLTVAALAAAAPSQAQDPATLQSPTGGWRYHGMGPWADEARRRLSHPAHRPRRAARPHVDRRPVECSRPRTRRTPVGGQRQPATSLHRRRRPVRAALCVRSRVQQRGRGRRRGQGGAARAVLRSQCTAHAGPHPRDAGLGRSRRRSRSARTHSRWPARVLGGPRDEQRRRPRRRQCRRPRPRDVHHDGAAARHLRGLPQLLGQPRRERLQLRRRQQRARR